MPTATMTSKGQITVPRPVRNFLKLEPGDRIDFVVEESGRVVLKRATLRVRELEGILYRPKMRPRSVEEMNRAIRSRARALK